jgi:hypothetical protein
VSALPRDFLLSEEALAVFMSNPVGVNTGAGQYQRRRDGMKARVEATVEVERRLGNLFTLEDVERFIHEYALMLLRMTPGMGRETEMASHYAEQQLRRIAGGR